VIIVGGGISGLVCSYAFSKHPNLEITIFEPGKVGGEFLSGGLKYVHASDGVKGMFNDLRLGYSDYQVRGGIMLKGKVERYPKCFDSMTKEQAKRIQDDHYRKTRRAEPGKHSKKAMNDPAARGPRTALRCDFRRMIEKLEYRANVRKSKLMKIIDAANYIWSDEGRIHPYDYLVLTIPLWVIRKCVNWYVPHGVAMKLNVIDVMGPRRDKYAQWDYVYTPYTPGDAIHRFSPKGEGYSMEVNGDLNMEDVRSDLNFIFSKGWYIKNVENGLKGHLLPLEQKPVLPDNVALLGRFAQWNSRATMDVVLDEAKALAERWLK